MGDNIETIFDLSREPKEIDKANMADNDEYKNGYENEYTDGFHIAMETVHNELEKCICTGEYLSGKEYRYIPYEDYKEVMKSLLHYDID